MASPSVFKSASASRWRTRIPPLAVPLAGLLLLGGVGAAAADPVVVRTQPGGTTAATTYALVGEARTWFGNVAGGGGNYSCFWTLEGVAQASFTPDDPRYIAVDHTIGTSGLKDITLTCDDADDGSDTPVSATTQVLALSTDNATRRRNAAIDNGLRYTYRQQNAASGCFPGNDWWEPEDIGGTGMALIAIQNHGHTLDSPDSDIYKEVVQRGLQCILDRSQTVEIGEQPCIGDPEAGDGNAEADGKGIRLADGDMYKEGIALLALVNATTEANAKTVFPTTSSGSELIDGTASLWDIAVDAKDYLAWAQTDEGPDGGGGAGTSCDAYDANFNWLGTIVGAGNGLTWNFDGYASLPQVFPDFPKTCGEGPWPWAMDYDDDGTDDAEGDSACPYGAEDGYSYIQDGSATGAEGEFTVIYTEAGDRNLRVSFNGQSVCTMMVPVGTAGQTSYCGAVDANGNWIGDVFGYTADGFTWSFDGYVYIPNVFQPRCGDGPWPWAADFGDGATGGPQDSTCPWGDGDSYTYIQDGSAGGGGIDASALTPGASIAGEEFVHTFADYGNYTVQFSFNNGAFCSMDIEVAEGGDCGANAWRYGENDSSIDNSAAQWPILALLEAKKRWGIDVSAAVKTETDGWLNESQDLDEDGNSVCGVGEGPGSYGYDWRCSWNNFAKAGAGLIMRDFTGRAAGEAMNLATLAYLGNTYGYTCASDYCNKGAWYSMYAFFKGMKLYGLPTLQVPAGGAAIDWQADYNAFVVASQLADGTWPGAAWIGSPNLSTFFALAILAPEVSGLPPVANAGGPYGPVLAETAFQLDGSNSTHLNPARSLVKYEWDFNAADGLWWDTKPAPAAAEGAFGETATNPGYPDTGADATYTITLRVTDDASPAQTDTDTTTVSVTTDNVPPTARTNGPWAGVPSTDAACSPTDPAAVDNPACFPITFDGSASSDDNGDAIALYEWDVDGDGQFNEANGDDGWPQGAAGTPDEWKVVKKLYTVPTSGTATLRVTEDTPTALTGTVSDQFVSVAFVFSTDYVACYQAKPSRFVQQQGIAVTFTNVGDGVAEDVVMTLSGTPSNVIAVKNVASLGDIGPQGTATSRCDGTYAGSEIVRNTLLNVPPGGSYSWTAAFTTNGVRYTIPNLPPLAP